LRNGLQQGGFTGSLGPIQSHKQLTIHDPNDMGVGEFI